MIWIATAVWAGIIFVLSGEAFTSAMTASFLNLVFQSLHLQVSASSILDFNFLVRKLAHLTEYAIFSLFLYYSFKGKRGHRWGVKVAWSAIIVAGLYSLTDEFHQSFVVGRTPSPIDCMIDTVGAACGIAILYAHTRLPRPAASKVTAAGGG